MKNILNLLLALILISPIRLNAEKLRNASLRGTTTTAPSSNSQFNQVTAYSIRWTTSDFDSDFFSHSTSSSPENLTIQTNGDYQIAYTVPLISTGARITVRAELFINNIAQTGSVSECSYTRGANDHSESSLHNSFLARNLAVGDVIELRVVQSSVLTTGVALVDGQASLMAEFVSPTRNLFSAETSTPLATNINTVLDLEWDGGRNDSSFVHSNTTNPEEITLLNTGDYLVYVNIPVSTPTTDRANVQISINLDGARVPGGAASQGYMRDDSNQTDPHIESSIHWSGVVSATAGQVLTIRTSQEANGGTVNIQPSLGSIMIEELDSISYISTRGQDLIDGTNWNPTVPEEILWENDGVVDTSLFAHSESSNPENITILEDGDYLVVYNDSLEVPEIAGNTDERVNPKIVLKVNGVAISGATTKTHYIRNASNHTESSASLVYLLENVSAGDVITVTTEREANSAPVNDSEDALLFIQRKQPYKISGTITDGLNPISGVTVDGGVLGTVLTNALGFYEFTGLDQNTNYTLTPMEPNFCFTPETVSSTLVSNNITENFTGDNYTISGTITSDGSPLAGITVDGGSLGLTITDASGYYEFSNILCNTSITITPSSDSLVFSPSSFVTTLENSNLVSDFTSGLASSECSTVDLSPFQLRIDGSAQNITALNTRAANLRRTLSKSSSCTSVKNSSQLLERSEEIYQEIWSSVWTELISNQSLNCTRLTPSCNDNNFASPLSSIKSNARQLQNITRRLLQTSCRLESGSKKQRKRNRLISRSRKQLRRLTNGLREYPENVLFCSDN